jgi:glycosyltransferase involved in cell wall biosynthesis
MNLLTVAIPTFNRSEALDSLLARVTYIKKSWSIKLLIIDNCSDPDESAKYALSIDRAREHFAVEFIRNKVNIGGAANVLRCLESVETEWVWLLGDDDFLDDLAFDRIFSEIASTEESAAAIKFDSNLYGDQRCKQIITSIDELFNYGKMTPGYFSNLLFMSSWVFKASEVKYYFRECYRYVGSFGPQLFLAFSCLNDNRTVVLAQGYLATCSTSAETERWDGTVVHNYLFENIRTMHFPISHKSLTSVRKVLFFDNGLKGAVGRVLRARRTFYYKKAKRLICGASGMNFIVFNLIYLVLEFIYFISRYYERLETYLTNKEERGSSQRH